MKQKRREKLNLSKTVLTILCLSIVQIGAAFGVVLYEYIGKRGVSGNSLLLIIIIIMAVLVNSYITVKDVKFKEWYDSEYSMLKDSLGQVEKLNNTLRGQRHDFMNHLQVVYSLMDMKEYDEAGNYIETVFHDIQRVSSILKTGNPAVNALLQAKLLYCEKREIELKLHITTRLMNLQIPAWEFCRILGNLVDNSIYALSDKTGSKFIELTLSEDLKGYKFKIKNNGPMIKQENIEHIFEAGFTTKGSKGDGMGLAITREILEEHNGDIVVTSTEQETFFEGWVPKLLEHEN